MRDMRRSPQGEPWQQTGSASASAPHRATPAPFCLTCEGAHRTEACPQPHANAVSFQEIIESESPEAEAARYRRLLDTAIDRFDAIRAHWQRMRTVGVTEADLVLMDDLVNNHELHSSAPLPAATLARLGLVEVQG